MALPAGFEPAAYGLEIRCSIQLSYGSDGREFTNWELLGKTAGGGGDASARGEGPAKKLMECVMRAMIAVGVVGAVLAGEAWAEKPNVEPRYAGKPLYGRIAFDLEGKTVVWTVLDSSGKNGERYDLLYFDRDADGDLTDEGELVKSASGTFEIGDFSDPADATRHTGLSISVDPEELDVMFRMKWRGGELVRGGYAPTPGPYLRYAEDPERAPLIRPIAEGPFAVQPWMLGALKIGGSTDVKFFLGHEGRGKHSFCAVTQSFLPAGDGLRATLIYRTKSGDEKSSVHKLLDRC